MKFLPEYNDLNICKKTKNLYRVIALKVCVFTRLFYHKEEYFIIQYTKLNSLISEKLAT